MATYKYQAYIQYNAHSVFDAIYNPGDITPYSGIYRCEGCTKEITSEKGNPLPPQNTHQHHPGEGTIRWRLIVYADHKNR